MADNKQIAVMFCCFVFLMSGVLAATEPSPSDYVGLNTCDLPQGAKFHYAMPVYTNKELEVAYFSLNNTVSILLLELNKSMKRRPREEIPISGTIRSVVSVDSPIRSNTDMILECRWKDKHNNDHLVGVVKVKPYKNPYGEQTWIFDPIGLRFPKQAWLVNLTELKFIPVSPELVECFVEIYD